MTTRQCHVHAHNSETISEHSYVRHFLFVHTFFLYANRLFSFPGSFRFMLGARRRSVLSVATNARRLRVDLVESVGKTSVGEDRLENALDDDVREAPVQSLVLKHVEHQHHALPSRLRSDHVTQLLCKQPNRDNVSDSDIGTWPPKNGRVRHG